MCALIQERLYGFLNERPSTQGIPSFDKLYPRQNQRVHHDLIWQQDGVTRANKCRIKNLCIQGGAGGNDANC